MLIEPLEREGILVKRSRELLETEIGLFRVLERDGRIIASAALYPFPEANNGELACIVTHPEYRGGDRGGRLLRELERRIRCSSYPCRPCCPCRRRERKSPGRRGRTSRRSSCSC